MGECISHLQEQFSPSTKALKSRRFVIAEVLVIMYMLLWSINPISTPNFLPYHRETPIQYHYQSTVRVWSIQHILMWFFNCSTNGLDKNSRFQPLSILDPYEAIPRIHLDCKALVWQDLVEWWFPPIAKEFQQQQYVIRLIYTYITIHLVNSLPFLFSSLVSGVIT